MAGAPVETKGQEGFLIPADGPAAERFGEVVIDAINAMGLVSHDIAPYWPYIEPRLIETFRVGISEQSPETAQCVGAVLGSLVWTTRQTITGYAKLQGLNRQK